LLKHRPPRGRRRSILRRLTAAVFALLVFAIPDGAASGHDQGAPIDLVPARVEAGEIVWVFGDDLAPSSAFVAYLVASDRELRVGEGETDEDGHALLSFTVPPGLPPATYEVRVTDEAGTTVAAELVVIQPASVSADPAADSAEPRALAIGAAAASALILVVLVLTRRRGPAA
jgi:hypothetical protein